MGTRVAYIKLLASSLLRYAALYPITRPSDARTFLNGLADWVVAYDLKERGKAAKSQIPLIELPDLFPGMGRVPLTIPYVLPRGGNVTFHEGLSLCAMAKHTSSKAIFEFGTFDGRTTLLLAMNSDPHAQVFTLDLPPDHSHAPRYGTDPRDATFFPGAREGSDRQYLNTTAAHKITQLLGDSATFDYSPYHGRMDFIFIDGSHSYEYVRSDSQHAFDMLSDDGIIVWHDYRPAWFGVFQFLRELCQQRDLFHIAGTSLVVYRAAR